MTMAPPRPACNDYPLPVQGDPAAPFRSGECHVLAQAAHEELGWDVAAIVDPFQPEAGWAQAGGDPAPDTLIHVYVVKDGTAFDADGYRPEEELIASFEERYPGLMVIDGITVEHLMNVYANQMAPIRADRLEAALDVVRSFDPPSAGPGFR